MAAEPRRYPVPSRPAKGRPAHRGSSEADSWDVTTTSLAPCCRDSSIVGALMWLLGSARARRGRRLATVGTALMALERRTVGLGGQSGATGQHCGR